MTESQIEVYRTALKEARASFDHAAKERRNAEIAISRRGKEMSLLRRTITALAAQCSEEPWADPMGITEACTEVMVGATSTMSTQDVVRGLEDMGFDVASQKNVSASVHAVLSRLAEKGKITKLPSDDGKVVSWRGPNYAEISDDDIPF